MCSAKITPRLFKLAIYNLYRTPFPLISTDLLNGAQPLPDTGACEATGSGAAYPGRRSSAVLRGASFAGLLLFFGLHFVDYFL